MFTFFTELFEKKRVAPSYFSPFLILPLVLTMGPCDEALSPYEEPRHVFQGTIEGEYALHHDVNAVNVYLTVRNVFDETFQEKASIAGSIEIVSARDATVKKKFSIKSGDFANANGYDRLTGVLTITPGDSIRVGVLWDFIDDNGRDLREDFFSYTPDPTCPFRFLARPEDFILRGNLKLYNQTAPVVVGPRLFSLCYVTAHVRPQECPPINAAEPCIGQRGQSLE